MARVVLEMERLRNTYTGLGQYCLHLGRALQRCRDIELIYFIPKKAKSFFESGRVIQYWHRYLPPTGLRADVWHCTHQESKYWPWPFAGLAAFGWYRRFWSAIHGKELKVVMTVHDLNFLEGDRYGSFRKWLKIMLLQNRVNRCDAIVCISNYSLEQAKKHLVWRKDQIVEVIYNGNCLDVTIPEEPVNRVVGLEKFVCSFGIHPKKQYHQLLPLFAKNEGLYWVIAGAGKDQYREAMLKTAASIGCADRLIFCGWVTEGQKLWIYRNCLALWFPSGAEGFGLPMIEAWSVGKPVFVWRGTSLTEIGGDSAFFWDSWDLEHLMSVWQSGMLRWGTEDKFAEGAQKRAKLFDWNNSALQYAALYTKLINR
jgi:glycosyltransferase involved in cell wall biosynthesis